MEFGEITARLSPPILPKEIDDLSWDAVEGELGVELPAGYKEFVATYGTGSIGKFLWIFNPASKNRSLNGEAIRYFQSSYTELKQDFPADYTRPTFPALNSFLPWAVTDNGDTLVGILCDKPPNSWKVGVMASDQVAEEIYESDFVEFIVQLLDQEIDSKILPRQFLDMKKTFQSF